MIEAVILLISVVSLVQFAVYYWRAIVAGVAAQPLSDRWRTAAGLDDASLGPAAFNAVLSLHGLTPELKDGAGQLWAVRAYYHVVEAIGRLAGSKLPPLSAWSYREMAVCSRYVAVLVDQRLEHNLACAAEIRSY